MKKRPRNFFSVQRTAAQHRRDFVGYVFLVLIPLATGVAAGSALQLPDAVVLWMAFAGAALGVLFILTLKLRALNVYRIPVALLNLPIYWLSTVIPKRTDLWIFCCRQGSAYAENPKYLFEQVVARHPEISAVWLTKSPAVYTQLKAKGMPVSMAYSVRGYWLSMRAGCLFMSNFKRSNADYNDYAVGPRTLKVQMWHGSPMKRIGSTRPYMDENVIMRMIRTGIYKLFPFYLNRASCHRMLAASPRVAETLKTAFLLADDNMWILGYPKNDRWLERALAAHKQAGDAVKVVYMPTWRLDGMQIFTRYRFNPEQLNAQFALHDIHFYIKLHHYTMEHLIKEFRALEGLSNIHILRVDDIYECLDDFDMLVTDYSSILFDYLLADRPVLFAPFDYDEYIKIDQGFLAEYAEISPGPHAANWEELGAAIVAACTADPYVQARRNVCAQYNAFRDSRSAERIVAETRAVLDSGVKSLQAAFH